MWNIAKSIIRPTSSLRMVSPLQGLQVQRLPRKDRMHTVLGGTTLYSEKRRARSTSILILVPRGQKVPSFSQFGELVSTHHSWATGKRLPSATDRYSSGVSPMPSQHRQNKDIHIKCGTEKVIIPNKEKCPAQALKTLSIHLRECSRVVAPSYAIIQECQALHTAFPTHSLKLPAFLLFLSFFVCVLGR